ncbi:MAG: LiaI-LiaF-like domain-containing protein, partial [Terriglobales bacterium]
MSSPAPQLRYPRRRSLAGPVVLIAIGVIFLLGNMHYLSWASLHHYFARYWPALLILWGVIKLVEHMQDTRAGVPSRGIGAGGVLLIVFLVLFGMGFTATDRINWGNLRNQMEIDDDLGGMFGNSYNFSNTLEQPFTAGTDLRVVSDRGDVVVNTWAEPKIKVVVRKKVVADNEDQGKKVDSQTQPTFTTAGSVMTLSANTGGSGSSAVASDLDIYMPVKANVDVSTRRGDIRVTGRDGRVTTSSHGDVTVTDNAGNVSIT